MFTKAIDCLTRFQRETDLAESESAVLDEVVTRLANTSRQYMDVRRKNDVMLEKDELMASMRQPFADENINNTIQELAKSDPTLKKWLESQGGSVRKVQSAEVRTLLLTESNEALASDASAEVQELHDRTELIYNNLWTVKVLLAKLAPFKSFNPAGVRNARNHLMQHTSGSGSGAYIYSFGIGTGGPILRPTKPSDASAPADPGLRKNVDDFLDQFVGRLVSGSDTTPA